MSLEYYYGTHANLLAVEWCQRTRCPILGCFVSMMNFMENWEKKTLLTPLKMKVGPSILLFQMMSKIHGNKRRQLYGPFSKNVHISVRDDFFILPSAFSFSYSKCTMVVMLKHHFLIIIIMISSPNSLLSRQILVLLGCPALTPYSWDVKKIWQSHYVTKATFWYGQIKKRRLQLLSSTSITALWVFSWLKCLSHEIVSMLLLLYKSFLIVTHHGVFMLF